MIIVGALFDFCDGLSARALNVTSPIGKELDSLADDITFGLAPAMMLFCFLKPIVGYWALIALLMAAFSALRLAKFNLDERQTSDFIGLATPPNALFWASVVTACQLGKINIDPTRATILLVLSLLSCYLLISEIPFFSLKFHSKTWTDNRVRYLFLFCAVIILVSFAVLSVMSHSWFIISAAPAAIICIYITIALSVALKKRKS